MKGLARIATLALISVSLTSCGVEKPHQVSSQGRQLCFERMAAGAPDLPLEQKRVAFRACLRSIDSELSQQNASVAKEQQTLARNQQAQTAARQTNWASDAERLVHCRFHQDQIIAAERDRVRALGPVMSITRQYGVNSPQARDADAAYQQHVAALERLIPESMRRGQPLLPTVVAQFMRCDAQELNAVRPQTERRTP